MKITDKDELNDFSVDRKLVNSKAYHDKFENTGLKKAVSESLYQESMKILEHRDGSSYEDLVALDADTGKVIVQNNKSVKIGKVGFFDEQYIEYLKHKGNVILLHNHPNNSRVSYAYIKTMYDNPEVVATVAIDHDGTVYIISNIDREKDIDKVYNVLYNKYKDLYYNKDIVEHMLLDDIYDLGLFDYIKR